MVASIKVNLDALIRREDFYVEDNESVQFQAVQTIQIRDLDTDALFSHVLRKPDFQRETSDWTPEKIAELVESYLKGDLIPSIILWNSGSYIFVIDGAHRLNALIAWVLNDYGDGPRSRSFLDQNVPDDQISSAEKARLIVRNKVGGDYLDHKIPTGCTTR